MHRNRRACLAILVIVVSLGCGLPSIAAQQVAAKNDPGAQSYAKNCAICHGDQREGNLPAFPPLVGIKRRMNDDQLTTMIRVGKGRMPGFLRIQDGELTALLEYLGTAGPPVTTTGNREAATGPAAAGQSLFHQNCAFCHGRDAMGGETGPDLTQSKLVLGDKTGEKIAQVIHEGRVEPKMPSFNFSSEEVGSLIAFIRWRIKAAAEHPGGRRGVSVADLQTGNAERGKAYFNGAGGCSRCHSPTGDFAGLASRLQGLQLEERMLYPRGSRPKVTVTLPTGEKAEGTLAYEDEFTIGLRDARGTYRSWRTDRVKFVVDDPAEAHVEQLPKYTDDDVHNLMAYLQTLK